MATIAELKSVQDLKDKLMELQTEQKRLAAENKDVRKDLEEKSKELVAAYKKVDQVRLESQQALLDNVVGNDRALLVFLESDEKQIAAAGGITNKDNARRPTKAYVNFGPSNEAMRMVGCEVNGAWEPGLIDDPDPKTAWHRRFQDLVDTRNLVRLIQGQGQKNTPAMDSRIVRHLRAGPPPIQKIFADASGVGAEWIPDPHMPKLVETLRMLRRIEALFTDMDMPRGGSALLPFLTTALRPYLAGTTTTDDPAQFRSSSLTTANRTLTTAKFAVRVQVDRDADEDSIIAATPLLRREVAQGLVDAYEDCCLNGDTLATHQDDLANWNIRNRWGADGLGLSDDHRRGFIGMRARATLVSNTVDQTAVQTVAGFQALRATLDSPHGLNDVIAVSGPEYMLTKIMLFAEVLTQEKHPLPTITGNAVSSLLGVPLVLSEFIGADLAATGLFTNSGALTGLAMFDRSRFWNLVRQGAVIEMATDITRDVVNIVSKQRKSLFTYDSSTRKNVAWGFNLATT